MERDHQRHPAPEPDGTRHMEPDHGVAHRTATARADVAHGETEPAPEPRRNLVPESRITYTGETVREWVRAALARSAAAGERFHYDASLVMVPSPNGMMSAYAIVIYTPSARLDLKPFGTVKMIGDFPSEKEVTDQVRSAVEELRQMQSQALRAPIDLSSFKPRG
jgi:hypothetical protein